MSKMTQEELTMLQSLPLSIKIEKTKLRIKEWYEHWNGQVYVSFSGGKDSTVLLDIARSMYPDIEAVFSDTGLEYPEIKEFVKTFENVTIVRPKYSFKEILTKYGYPIISKEVANVVANSRRWIAQNIGEAEGKPVSDYYIKRLIGLQEFANPNRGGAEQPRTLSNTRPEEPPESNIGGADREWRKLRGLGEYTKMPQRAAKLFGMLDKKGNVRKCAEGEKSQFSQERWKWLLNSDFRISDRCCYHMKKSPLARWQKKSGKKPIIATMTEESMQRKMAWLKTGCNAFDGKQISKPMSFWTEQDILEYIDIMELDVAPVYGTLLYSNGKYHFDGCQRTGCIFCGFGCHLEHEPNRFQRLKETHPKLYQYCMYGGEYDSEGVWVPNNKGLGIKHVLDFINVKSE